MNDGQKNSPEKFQFLSRLCGGERPNMQQNILVPMLERGNERTRDVISTKSSHVAVMLMNAVVQLGGLLSERLEQTRVSNRPDISVHWFALLRT